MKAARLTAYGAPDVLRVVDLERPSPGARQLLVEVQASTVTAGDAELRTMAVPWLFRIPLRLWLGVRRPRAGFVTGMEFAGVVRGVGEGTPGWNSGDAVFGATGPGFGANAEFVVVPADGVIARLPSGVEPAAAATLPIGGLAALGYLRKGGIASGRRVLIRGASGSIGTYAVQLARHFGAHVTGICGTDALDWVRELGAHDVIDYTASEWTDAPERYDLILDVVGKLPIARCVRMLEPGGTYVRGTIPGVGELLAALRFRLLGSRRVVLGDAGETVEDLRMLGDLLAQGVLTPVIDRRMPLAQIAEAHALAETGHKQGHIVITPS